MAKIVLTISADNKATASVKALNRQVKELAVTLSSIKVNKDLTAQIKALNQYNKTLITVTNSATKQATAEAKRQKTANATTAQVNNLQKGFANLINTINSLEKSYKKGTFNGIKTQTQGYLTEVKGLDAQLKSGAITQETYNNRVQELTVSLQSLTTQMATTRAETKSTHGSLLDIISGFAKFQLSAMAVMKPLQLMRSALSSINETLVSTEDRVIELQRVVGDVANANELYDLAQKYGQTFDNVSEATLNFARRGMSWNESLKATEAALLAINVAELDVGQATDGLGAIMAQFGKEASELTNVVDMLNKTADKFPVTTSKILAALQRVGSTASTANLSLEETIGLITTLSKSTNRSGENIGTALNSILNIVQKSSTLDTFSKLGDSVAKVVEQYRGGGTSILEVLRAVSEQVQQLDTNQIFSNEDFAGLNEQLKEQMGEDFEMLSEIYGTAGTYRRNYFIALLNDLDTVKQVESEIANAQGYSQKENQQYLDTYTAKLNKLNAQWQEIANSQQGLLGIKKMFVDIGSAMLWVVKHTGGLRTTFIALSTLIGATFGSKIINSIGNFVDGLFKAKTAADGLKLSLNGVLGVIGLVATAISLVVGVAKSINEAREQARQKNIDEWKNAEESAKKLISLYNEYDALSKKTEKSTEETQKFVDIQNSLKEAIGTNIIRLQGLKEGTKEYTEALKEQVEWQIKSNAYAAQNAATSAQTKFDKTKFNKNGFEFGWRWAHDADGTYLGGQEARDFADFLEANGFNIDRNNGFWDYFTDSANLPELKLSGDTLKDEQTLRELVKILSDNNYGNTGFYVDVYGAWQERLNAIKENVEIQATNEAYKYIKDNGFPETQEEIDKIINSVMTLTKTSETTGDSFKEWQNIITLAVTSITGTIEKATDETNDTILNNIAKVTQKYDNLIKKLEELRDKDKELVDLEEKKKDYIEEQNELIKAQQALENARNEATVRRFNEATGQWEWQVDEKKVAEAEEAVKKQEESVEKAREELEKQAYDAIIDLLDKNKPPTNDELNTLLGGLKDFLGEQFIADIKEAFKDKTGVDLDKPVVSNFEAAQNYINQKGLKEADREKWTEDETFAKLWNALTEDEQVKLKGTYDSGGIANGLGYMAKATKEPEVVNDPKLTKLILTPNRNEEFLNYAKALGIMFEQSHNFAQRPQFERVNNSTDNRVDNSGQVYIQGVNVGAERRDSILEALTISSIIPKV